MGSHILVGNQIGIVNIILVADKHLALRPGLRNLDFVVILSMRELAEDDFRRPVYLELEHLVH